MTSKTKIIIGIVATITFLTILWFWNKQLPENNDVDVILPIDSSEEAISYAKTDSEVNDFIMRGLDRGIKVKSQAEFYAQDNVWSVIFSSDETQLMMTIYPNGTISSKGYGI